ncbi:beta-fructofuranosidase [Arthrobacter alpinus]|uniref:beta-fructofuranosidase n=1 Tax=Arthrobacter alpinus TaxID=656366 RepID=A0A1H5MQ08_9MICC|nr:glycoside hydrolase family 32 protein [Arthrobacter alpinus]SEE90827.1 beta-fructofuranosidase [Arthrobacter alpinus]
MSTTDPAFPALHGRPDQGWINDPNGCIYVDGTHHVFFQLNPDAPTHGNIHWGHATSTDLVRWTQQPTALFPRMGAADAAGVWSGVIALDGEVPTAYYTGIAETEHKSQVMTATSNRALLEWKQEQHGIVGMPEEPNIGDVRDPFLFTFNGSQYAIQGAGYKDGTPVILLYRCHTMTQWEYLGPLVTGGAGVAAEWAPAQIWECPQLFRVDGQWVLMLSLWNLDNHDLDRVTYLTGELSEGGAGLKFLPTGGGLIDDGPDFYAPQVVAGTAAEPRTLMWGWSWEKSRPEADIHASGWAGVLTYARELSFRDGALVSAPVAEVDTLRAALMSDGAETFTVPVQTRAFEVLAAGVAELVLVDGGSERVVASITAGRILVDGSLIEIFAADGTARTIRAYPTATSRFEVRGEAVVNALAL